MRVRMIVDWSDETRLLTTVVARAAGIEPATFGFGDQCCYQLSYTPKIVKKPDKEHRKALFKTAEAAFGRNRTFYQLICYQLL